MKKQFNLHRLFLSHHNLLSRKSFDALVVDSSSVDVQKLLKLFSLNATIKKIKLAFNPRQGSLILSPTSYTGYYSI